jgi:CheY-like chemotaxis protein
MEPQRILIVDDDVDLRHTLCELLSDEGYRVQGAENGAEALALLRSGAPLPHLLLLDLMMPVMDGWQLRAALRSDPRLAHLPVVVLTASRNLGRSPALEVNALAYKPLQLERLLDLVAQHAAHEPSAWGSGPHDAHAH